MDLEELKKLRAEVADEQEQADAKLNTADIQTAFERTWETIKHSGAIKDLTHLATQKEIYAAIEVGDYIKFMGNGIPRFGHVDTKDATHAIVASFNGISSVFSISYTSISATVTTVPIAHAARVNIGDPTSDSHAATKKYVDDDIKYYKGQILQFNAIHVKFEKSDLFERHMIQDGYTILGGANGVTTLGSEKDHTHSITQQAASLDYVHANNFDSNGNRYTGDAVYDLALWAKGSWDGSNTMFGSGNSDGGSTGVVGSYNGPKSTSGEGSRQVDTFYGGGHIHYAKSPSGSTSGNMAAGVKLIHVVYIAKRDITSKEMR